MVLGTGQRPSPSTSCRRLRDRRSLSEWGPLSGGPYGRRPPSHMEVNMPTYRERAAYLHDAVNDEDCPGSVYRKYTAELDRIHRRALDWRGDDGIDLDEEMTC